MKCAVLDTNILVSAARSREGASFAILQALRQRRFVALVSVPLMLAEKVSAFKTESYFRERIARGDDAAFDTWLNSSPAMPPGAGDEMPR